MQFVDLRLLREMIDFGVCRHLIVLVVELYQTALFLLQFVEIDLLLVALCGTVLI